MEQWLMVASVISVFASLLVHLEVIPANRSIIPYGFLFAVIFWGLSTISIAKRGPKSDMSFLFHKKQNDDQEK